MFFPRNKFSDLSKEYGRGQKKPKATHSARFYFRTTAQCCKLKQYKLGRPASSQIHWFHGYPCISSRPTWRIHVFYIFPTLTELSRLKMALWHYDSMRCMKFMKCCSLCTTLHLSYNMALQHGEKNQYFLPCFLFSWIWWCVIIKRKPVWSCVLYVYHRI